MSHGGYVWEGGDPTHWQDHSANIRPEGAPIWVRNAIEKGMDNLSYYPEPEGIRASKGIAEYLEIAEKYVVATAGGISAIDMAVGLGVGDILLLGPCFTEYARQAEARGKRIRQISLLTAERKIDLSCAYDAIRHGDCVWLAQPMNPSGFAFDLESIKKLLERVERAEGYLFIDEAFVDYCPDYSARGLITEHERLIITGSLTKSLGIPGVRLGYLCGQPAVLDKVRILRRPWEVNCFAEAIAMELPNHKTEMREDAEANRVRKEFLASELVRIGAYVYDSEADFLLCEFPIDAHVISMRLKEAGILVRECLDYEMINNGRHLRIAVKTDDENRRLVRKLEEVLQCAESH